MKLYLVQHGEACAKEQNPERPLTEQGMADVKRVADFLKQAGVTVARVLHSGKLRAQQTAEVFAKAIATDTNLEISDIINPNDDPKAFSWQSESWDKDILVVGHLPFMAKLVSLLIVKDEDNLFASFQPGTVICLEREEDEIWVINWMVRPELLS